MASSKCVRRDENTPKTPIPIPAITFTAPWTDSAKKPRHRAVKFASEDDRHAHHRGLIKQRILEEKSREEDRKNAEKKEADRKEMHARTEARARMEAMFSCLTAVGFETLYQFLDKLINTKDPIRSSQVLRTLIDHGDALLNSICRRNPERTNTWALNVSGEIIALKGTKLAERFRPAYGTSITSILDSFSLEQLLADTLHLAPHLCALLRRITAEGEEDVSVRKNHDLVSHLVVFILDLG